LKSAAATQPVGIHQIQSRITVHEDVQRQRTAEAAQINFATLYNDYKRKIYATVHKVVGPTPDIDDIVQVVFLEIHRSLPKYRGSAKLSTWIYRITVNVALQHIRKKKRQRVFLFFKDEEREIENVGFDLEPRYHDRDVLRRLYKLLGKLSEKKRIVFVLHELEGVPLEEVAEICDIPFNTVRSRLHSARTELMTRMQKGGVLERSQ